MRDIRVGLLLSILMSGCGGGVPATSGNDDMAVPVPHNFAEINELILKNSCASFSVCHSARGAAAAGSLNLADDPYEALVGAASVNARALAEGMPRVKPCDPDHSLLVVKLELPESEADAHAGYGGHMPQSNAPLPAAQIQAIRDWIARGAQDQESTATATCAH